MVGAMTGLCGKLSLLTNGIDHNAEENCVTKAVDILEGCYDV